MKKTTIKKEQKDFFYSTDILGDVAIIYSVISGKSGLLNIKTNELIGDLDYYSTKIDSSQERIIQTKNNPISINYYDIEKHEYLVYNFELVKTLVRSIYLLKSKVNNKTYLLDKNMHTDSIGIFDIEVDDADYLDLDDRYLILTLNGKKALYKAGNGLVKNFEFDEINSNYKISEYVISYAILIFKKNNKCYFSYYDDNFSSISEEFERIEVDKNYGHILYCYKDKETHVYDIYNKLLVLKTAKKVEYVDYVVRTKNKNEYFFIAREGDKQEILSSIVNEDSKEINVKTLVSGCDKISLNRESPPYNMAFNLEKNKKKGIFLGSSSKSITIEPNYTDVEYLRNDFYILTSNDISDIVRFNYDLIMETKIESCSIVEKTNYAVIYSKKDNSETEKVGLFFPKNGNVVPGASTSIKVLSKHFYEALENGKKGIFYLENLIIPKEYENIQISFSPKYENLDDAIRVYFSLKKEKSCLLAEAWGFQVCPDNKIELEILGEYKDIYFLKDIIVCRTKDNAYIYDYNYILLCKVSSNAVIAPVEGNLDYNTSLYNIDGIYYYYRDNKLIKLYQNVISSYITTYETDTDLFEVSTNDKNTLEAFSNYIDSMKDNLGEETLISYSLDNCRLKEKYPSLVLKKQKKK